MVVISFQDHRLGPAHAPQHVDACFPEVRRHRHRARFVRDPHPVGQGIVRNLEERRRKAAHGTLLSRSDRVRAKRIADARGGEDRYGAVANEGLDTARVVGVSVGEEDRPHVAQVPTKAAQMGLYAPSRETGIHQKAARGRLHIGRVARASARKNA